MRGTVKWFDDEKGYGFVNAPGVVEDIFVYFKDIRMPGFKSLSMGQAVEFELVPNGDRGVKAKDCYPLYAGDLADWIVGSCAHVGEDAACRFCIQSGISPLNESRAGACSTVNPTERPLLKGGAGGTADG